MYVYSNIRLIFRFTKSYNDGSYRKQDIDPKTFNLDDITVRLEELRWREGVKDNVVQESNALRYYEQFKVLAFEYFFLISL